MIEVPISSSAWVGLAIVAGARVAKGNQFRNNSQDRGIARNHMNDLVGCVGEYAAVMAALSKNAKVEHDLFYADGPLKQADLIANGTSFDAKALMFDSSRKYFILDQKAVATAADKGIAAFVPVIARCYGDTVLVGDRISIEDASKWPLKDFGYGAARAEYLQIVTLDYFGKLVGDLMQATGADVFSDSAEAMMSDAFAYGAALKHDGIAVWTEGKDVEVGLETLNNQFIKQRS